MMHNISKPTSSEAKSISNLEMQAVFYWILGGLGLFASFFLFIYGVILGAVFYNDFMREIMDTIGPNLVELIGGIYLACFLYVFSLSILQIIQGFKLNNRKSMGFSIFVAIYSLLAFPFGTLLGIFTLALLSRKSVKDLYFNEMQSRFERT